MKKLYEKELGRWGIALFAGVFLFVIVSVISPKAFFINDDENIMYTLAGYYTNGIPGDHSFVNYVLASALRGLYSLFPRQPWYGIFHVYVLLFAVVIVEKTIIKEGFYADWSIFQSLLIGVGLFLTVLVYPTILMQFTTTAAFAGTAAVALVLGRRPQSDSKVEQTVDGILSGIFLLLCYMHRKNTGYVILCFYVGTVLLQYVKIITYKKEPEKKGGRIKRFSKQTIIAIAFLVCIIGIDSAQRSTAQWKEFYEYDNARFKVTDYPHDSFEENPELYKSIGWNTELYELAGKSWWFFMDPAINLESFQEIAQTGYYDQEPTNLSEIIVCAKELFLKDAIALITFISSAFAVFSLGYMFTKKKCRQKCMWECIYICCIALGSFALCAYLLYRQRFPLRAYQTIAIPAAMIFFVEIVRLSGAIRKNESEKGENWIKKGGSILLFLVAVAIGGYTSIVAREQAIDRIEKSNRTLQIEYYAMQNPENFYVYDTSLTFRYLPFTVYTEKYPSNLMFWGGMGWNSPTFFKQLEMNGLDYLYSDVLLQENVYYITWDEYMPGNRTMKDRLVDYMKSIYPNIYLEQVDEISNNIHIYKFVQK